ncbi:glycosyltransferase family 39 protein [Streptantibioticus parmotrematis]|uniref:glycosyltransferase family 39 protein n=1 Tax=Streptantibioticus parmotrematis TaxID=2873249 RepID=UPI0033EBF5DC
MTLAGAPARRRPLSPAWRRAGTTARDPRLALVCLAYTVLQLLLAAPGRSLAWDESIYFSQVDPRAPAAFFSAPRSRGVTLLGAPVALFTSDPLAIRVFLAVLSGLALFGAFAVWRRLVGGGTAALAALLFGTLWVSLEYGAQMMPNLWVAFGAVAAAGFLLLAVREGPRGRYLLGLALSVGWPTLVRAPDGVWLALPLLAAVALVPSWRSVRPAAAIAVGLAAGLAEWVAEAYARFGGIGQRLSDSSVIEGGMGLSWNVGNALRSADGPLLCRPCDVGYPPALDTAWWLALPVLAVAGLVVAHRTGRTASAVLPVVCAVALSVPYLFLIPYAAPRFLLPAYALLALPVAGLLTRGVRAVRLRPTGWRLAAAASACALLVGHWAVQLRLLDRQIVSARGTVDHYQALAEAVGRAGVHPPCLLAGWTQPIAYDARCASSVTSYLDTDASVPSPADVLRAARHETVAVLVDPGSPPPAYARGWQRRPLSGKGLGAGWAVYVPRAR